MSSIWASFGVCWTARFFLHKGHNPSIGGDSTSLSSAKVEQWLVSIPRPAVNISTRANRGTRPVRELGLVARSPKSTGQMFTASREGNGNPAPAIASCPAIAKPHEGGSTPVCRNSKAASGRPLTHHLVPAATATENQRSFSVRTSRPTAPCPDPTPPRGGPRQALLLRPRFRRWATVQHHKPRDPRRPPRRSFLGCREERPPLPLSARLLGLNLSALFPPNPLGPPALPLCVPRLGGVTWVLGQAPGRWDSCGGSQFYHTPLLKQNPAPRSHGHRLPEPQAQKHEASGPPSTFACVHSAYSPDAAPCHRHAPSSGGTQAWPPSFHLGGLNPMGALKGCTFTPRG